MITGQPSRYGGIEKATVEKLVMDGLTWDFGDGAPMVPKWNAGKRVYLWQVQGASIPRGRHGSEVTDEELRPFVSHGTAGPTG